MNVTATQNQSGMPNYWLSVPLPERPVITTSLSRVDTTATLPAPG